MAGMHIYMKTAHKKTEAEHKVAGSRAKSKLPAHKKGEAKHISGQVAHKKMEAEHKVAKAKQRASYPRIKKGKPSI